MKREHVPSFIPRDLAAKFQELGLVMNDPDNHRALWFGLVLLFTAAQNICWQSLWQNFMRGNLPIPQGRILSGWPGSSCQVADIFKRHPAWKTIIVGDGRGHLWLNIPPNYLDLIGNGRTVEPSGFGGRSAAVSADRA